MGRPEIVGHLVAGLLRRLSTGEWAEGSRMPSNRELARSLRVSRPTVCKALQRLTELRLVSPQSRRFTVVLPGAVRRAKDLLRRHNKSRRRRGPKVAILIPEEDLPLVNPFHMAAVHHLERQCAERDGQAKLVPLPFRDQVTVARSLAGDGYEVAVCVDFELGYTPTLFQLHGERFPVVLFNRRFPWLQFPAVRIDDVKATRQIIDALVLRGHRNLCLVSHFSAAESPGGRNEVSIWTEYLGQLGLLGECTVPLRILPWMPKLRQNEHLFADVFLRPDRPTGIIFTAELWARHFLSDPRFSRFRVPDDMSLAILGPGEGELSVPQGPLVTSLRMNHQRAAECVLEIISKMLAGNSRPATIRVPLDIQFTESIGPAPKGA